MVFSKPHEEEAEGGRMISSILNSHSEVPGYTLDLSKNQNWSSLHSLPYRESRNGVVPVFINFPVFPKKSFSSVG